MSLKLKNALWLIAGIGAFIFVIIGLEVFFPTFNIQDRILGPDENPTQGFFSGFLGFMAAIFFVGIFISGILMLILSISKLTIIIFNKNNETKSWNGIFITLMILMTVFSFFYPILVYLSYLLNNFVDSVSFPWVSLIMYIIFSIMPAILISIPALIKVKPVMALDNQQNPVFNNN